MSTRRRPSDCCSVPNEPVQLEPIARVAVVDIFKALADATRFEIFRFVAAQASPICACDVVDRFQVSQPTISHHMKVLRDAGLITVSRRGVWAYYQADPKGLDNVLSIIGSLAPEQLRVAS